MSKQSLETSLRNSLLTALKPWLEQHFEADVLPVSASELAIPVLNEEGDESWLVVKVSTPRGARVDGSFAGYDGYAAAEDWAAEVADREAKAKAREEKKAHEEAEKKRKREARKTIKTMKKEVKEILPTATE